MPISGNDVESTDLPWSVQAALLGRNRCKRIGWKIPWPWPKVAQLHHLIKQIRMLFYRSAT